MEKRLLPNNVTLAGLRRLRRELKEIVGDKVPVHITMSLWHHGSSGSINEKIGVYHETGESTKYFHSLKEAHNYLKQIKKEKANDNSSS